MLVTIIIIAVVALVFILCLKKVIGDIKSGECTGCGGNCAGCHKCDTGSSVPKRK